MSFTTDQELHEIADLLIPTVAKGRSPANHGRRPSDNSNRWYGPPSDTDSADEAILPHLDSRFRNPPPSMPAPIHPDSEYGLRSDRPTSAAAYAAFHLPRPIIRSTYTSDSDHVSDSSYQDHSDTPSLVYSASQSSYSGSSSRSAHSYASPSTPNSSFLSIIEENYDTSHRMYGSHISHNERGGNSLGSRESLDFIQEAPKTADRTPKSAHTFFASTERGNSVDTLTDRTALSVPVSPASPRGSPLARLLKKKDSQLSLPLEMDMPYSQPTAALDAKALKAEQKRQRKEESKARKEQLAHDLKARALMRAAQDKASLNSQEKKKKEIVAMYGDPSGFVM